MNLVIGRSRRIFAAVLFFLSLFFPRLNSCEARQLPEAGADFYQALFRKEGLTGVPENAGEDAAKQARKEAASLFEKALNSANAYIRRAAAEELLVLNYEGTEIPKPALNRAWKEASGAWAAAAEVLKGLSSADAAAKDRILEFVLGSGTSGGLAGSGTWPPGEAVFYVLRECQNKDAGFFNSVEDSVITGHINASRSRFGEALASFRSVLDGDARIFLRYPDLLGDLGRCFQYAAIGTEGMDLLLDWERNLSPEESAGTRFRLLFFAARIARQRGLADQGIELFIRALPYAPGFEQADACIWYILDTALSRGPAALTRRLETFVPQWHDDEYFFDVLDKLSRELITRRQWKELIGVFSLIQNHSGASTAKYAWIIGRALEEGYLSPEEIRLAAEALGTEGEAGQGGNAELAAACLRASYRAGTWPSYYRSLSAVALGKPFLDYAPEDSEKSETAGDGQSEAMEFLLGFFKALPGGDAAAAGDEPAAAQTAFFAFRYIAALEKDLSIEELRILARALGEAGLYPESIRLVSAYSEREDYELNRQDLEISFPRPFKELVEKYAEETGIEPELLFGLIRTESAFQSGIVSRAGAVGLTQLMPATAEEMAGRIRRQGGPDYAPDLLDPETNIHIGAVYLAYLKDRMKDPLLALLSYNGGMNRVRRWRTADSRVSAMPADLFLETVEFSETREYGRRVMAAAAAYGELYQISQRIR